MRASDFWETPASAFTPEFMGLLPDEFRYAEPCYGGGAIERHIPKGKCVWRSDRYPEHWRGKGRRNVHVPKVDARYYTDYDVHQDFDFFLTNMPWRREHLFAIMDNLLSIAPIWTILPDTFIARRNSAPYMSHCSDVMPVGVVNWMPEKDGNGRCTYSWFRFTPHECVTMLHHRSADKITHSLHA